MSSPDPWPPDPARPLRGARPDQPAQGQSADHPAGSDPAQDSRAEQVLSQALRVMAGGGKPPPKAETSTAGRRFSTTQLVLLAAIIGLLVGAVAGLLSLL